MLFIAAVQGKHPKVKLQTQECFNEIGPNQWKDKAFEDAILSLNKVY